MHKTEFVSPYVVALTTVNLAQIAQVGGKNASTGEMLQQLTAAGIPVPGGFATTVAAYRDFLAENKLDEKIYRLLNSVKVEQLSALNKVSQQIQQWIIAAPFSNAFKKAIAAALPQLGNKALAIRSSATAEDLPNASFAGQQASYLNVKGLKNVLKTIKLVFASLFTARAIAYRQHQGFSHQKFAISVGMQPMIRSDQAVSGVMFTLDTESGFDKVVLISASYGLGEAIVQGKVNTDEFFVYKPSLALGKSAILQRKLGSKAIKMIYNHSSNPQHFIKTVKVPLRQRAQFALTDKEIETLARYAVLIEKHYGKPMDMEWAKDGKNGKLYIVQARPETVKSQTANQIIEHTIVGKKGKLLARGQSIGQHIGQGAAKILRNPRDMNALQAGEVLVTDMTDPDWEPIMKKAAAIVTNRGGRTCHAAIIARELGIPAVVGCGDATRTIPHNKPITVSCAEGSEGYVYAGKIPFQVNTVQIASMPKIPVDLCINIGNPDRAFAVQFLPNEGVGLARIEFIISDMIGIHPNAILNLKKLPKQLQTEIRQKTQAYANPREFYVEKLAEGIAMIAAAFAPKQVIFRFSDFKSNEYANLLGGKLFEPQEENPMIGFRGASRYRDIKFQPAFQLECEAFKRVREKMGLVNAQVMVPFVRTVDEIKEMLALMAKYSLKRGENGLKLFMMCEIPSNVILAEEFLKYVDGYSIGSNDLTQLMLGLDRDSNLVAPLFDERNAAIKAMLHQVIQACRKANKYIGICGQGPSDHPDFAAWLVNEGIESMSLNPDTVVKTWLLLAKK